MCAFLRVSFGVCVIGVCVSVCKCLCLCLCVCLFVFVYKSLFVCVFVCATKKSICTQAASWSGIL